MSSGWKQDGEVCSVVAVEIMVEGDLMAGSSVPLVALTSGYQKVSFRTFNNYFDYVLTTRTTVVGPR